MVLNKKFRIAGWVLSILLAVLLIGPSAMGKIVDWDKKDEMLDKMGISAELLQKIGVLEITLAILFLIPRTGFLGAILLTGYLGGATLTHLRIGESFIMPIIIGVVMWVALGFRQPIIFEMAFGKVRTDSIGSQVPS